MKRCYEPDREFTEIEEPIICNRCVHKREALPATPSRKVFR